MPRPQEMPPPLPHVIELDEIAHISDLAVPLVFNFPSRIVVVFAPEKKVEPRIDLKVESHTGYLHTITAWNHHANAPWHVGEWYLFCRAEASRPKLRADHDRDRDVIVNVNVWSTSPVMRCDGEFAHLA